MKKNTFWKIVLLMMIFSTFSLDFVAQTIPENTRLFQLNAKKGSRLSIVENTDNFVYHIGTNNSSDVKFGNLSLANKGFDDLFILKSKIQDGSHVWLKAIDAGVDGKITPSYASVDNNENLVIYGKFLGSITVAGKTINSTGQNDAFLLKLNQDGLPLWIQVLPNGYNTTFKTSYTTDGTDAFLLYGGTNLIKIDPNSGTILLNKSYPNFELKSVALFNNGLYLAGSVTDVGYIENISFTESNVGFVVKGDKNANFNTSLETRSRNLPQSRSDVGDIAFTNDGKLVISGFSVNSIYLKPSNGQLVDYTYNPNADFTNNRMYHYVAKVDSNLQTVNFLKTSSPISQDVTYGIISSYFSTDIRKSNNNFNILVHITDRFRTITEYTNINGSITTLPDDIISSNESYSLLLKCDTNANAIGDGQVINRGIRMSSSSSMYTKTDNIIRIFGTNIYNINSNAQIAHIEKTQSNGGGISKYFAKHLKSVKDEMFVSALLEAKNNFFGTLVNNNSKQYSQYIARLSADGQAKWVAHFDNINGELTELNISGDFVTIDQEDNLYIWLNALDSSSKFTDAAGTVVNYSEPTKALIKLNKDGKLLWHKKITSDFDLVNTGCAIRIDNNGDPYIFGQAYDQLNFENQTILGNSIFISKLTKEGAVTFLKIFENFPVFNFNPVFDSQNNLYAFLEPVHEAQIPYNLDGIMIPSNENGLDFLMLKFNNNANVIWGKNFYATNTSYSYAWSNDVAYDGTDFVLFGNYWKNRSATNYIGLDMLEIPSAYSTNETRYTPFIAKVSPSGAVAWQKILDVNTSSTGAYTNIMLDENKNTYVYYYSKGKVKIDNTEYQYNPISGSKAVVKFGQNGILKYHKIVDNSFFTSFIDVIGEDKLLLSGLTSENNILNYSINNQGSNFYVATLGKLDAKYLTPTQNYLSLTNAEISNDPTIVNAFNFDLINNVSWTAVSDQNWLSLSFTNLTNGKGATNTISGNGDAKITLTAQVNNTGVTRNASVLVSGDQNVTSKTVIVTQSGILANNEVKTFVTVIYPNPTSDILNIQTEQKISKIEIFDMSGKLVKTQMNGDKKIDISKLLKGSYLINIVTDQTILKSKFIKN